MRRATVAGFTEALATVAIPLATLVTPAAGAATTADVAGDGLQEVVVTAAKRAETLQSVPISVSVIGGATLGDLKLDTPAAIAELTPGLHLNSINGGAIPVFALRGVSMFDYSFNQSSPIASYFDEVYKGGFVLQGVEMFDLDRIEVLSGPQGTLYGKNATGGAINFYSKKPTFDTEGYIKVGIGNFNRREAEGAVQTPIVKDVLTVRLAMTYAKADGWTQNLAPGQPDMGSLDQWAARLSALFTPTENLDMLLRFAHSQQTPVSEGILPVPGPLGIGNGVYTQFHLADPTHNPYTDYFRTGLNNNQIEYVGATNHFQQTDDVSLTAHWRFAPGYELTSITSYNSGQLNLPDPSDGAPIEVFRISYFARARQFTQDMRIASTGAGPLGFIGGLYYQHEVVYNTQEIKLYNNIDVNGDGTIDYQDCLASGGLYACDYWNQFDQKRDSWAAYTDASYALTNQWKARVGLRYNHDNGALRNFVAQMRGPDQVPLANLIPGDPNNVDSTLSHDLHNTATTGRVGLDYTPTESTLFYGSYSRGYRSGAFAAQAFFLPQEATIVVPETLDAIELGFKTRWLADRLQVNGAVFHYNYKNQQIIDFDPVTAAQPLVNLRDAKIRGLEVNVELRPIRTLMINATGSLLDARLTDATLRGTSINGNLLPNAPKASASLGVDWQYAQVNTAQFSLHLDQAYQSYQYFEPFNEPQLRQGGYSTLNGRLKVATVDAHWDAGVWARNLTNKFYLVAALDLSGFGYQYTRRAPPRMFGVDMRYRF